MGITLNSNIRIMYKTKVSRNFDILLDSGTVTDPMADILERTLSYYSNPAHTFRVPLSLV